MLGATKSDRELSLVIAIVATHPDKEIRTGRVALLLGISRGLRRDKRSIRVWVQPSPETGVPVSPDLQAFLEQLERVTASNEDPTRRALGLACLAAARPAVAAGQVGSMLTAEEPELVQDAAARVFGELDDPELAAKVLDRWTSYSIATRSRLLAAMASSRVLATSLLDAIETKQIHTRELEPTTRANLSQFRDSAIRTRVEKLLEVVESDREGIVKRFRDKAEDLRAQGRLIDLNRGATLFADHCATCHRLGGTGTAVGPDLSAIASRTPDVLFDDILHPSREVSPDFRNYVLSTRDGRIFTGLLVADRPTGVTLRGAGGLETQVARAEVEELRLTEKSLMPEGFESTLDPGSIRDLVEFLRQPVASRSP
jgi:putative heme-binding domain-containing protein